MRADRLLSFLLLLQTRGRQTAASLARELEVSERTIYRDLEALSAAGIPVYAERGPGGGIALLDSYRTALTGLTPAEARVLLLLEIPEPLARLGLGAELKTALRKVLAAAGQTASPPPVYLDWEAWGSSRHTVPFLPLLYQAICQHCRVRITYRLPIGVEVERLVDPCGLVGKAGEWYLVSHGVGKFSIHRVAELNTASLCNETFDPPARFDLEAFWKEHARQIESYRQSFTARVRLSPAILPALEQSFGEPLRAQISSAQPDPDGRLEVDLAFENFEVARARLLSYGGAVEVLDPPQLRLGLLDFARQIAGMYAGQESNTPAG